MKLYFSPGACSLAPHIVARELDIPIELDRVKDKKTSSGEDFWAINPKGYVPTLRLDDGAVLTEGPVVMQYLADLKPESGLAPPHGSRARLRLQEWLGYINSELHKSFSPLFSPATPAETKEERVAYLKKRFALVDAALANDPYLSGSTFGIADAYLFTVTRWASLVKLDLSALSNLTTFQERVAGRPKVREALKAEGILRE